MSPRSRVFSFVAARRGGRLGRRRGRRARDARPRPARRRAAEPAARRWRSTSAFAPIPEARDLDRAQRLYARQALPAGGGDLRPLPLARGAGRHGARRVAGRDDSTRLENRSQAEHPESALARAPPRARLLLGLRRNADASRRLAHGGQRLQPDTAYAVRADDFLHPQFAPGLPRFVPSFQPPLAGPRAARARSRSPRCAPPPRAVGPTRRSSTAPPCSSSASRSRPSGSSPPPRAWRPTTRTLASPRRSAASTRRTRPARVRHAGPARARVPARPDRPLPPRRAARSGRHRSRTPASSSRWRSDQGTDIAPRTQATQYLAALGRSWDRLTEK